MKRLTKEEATQLVLSLAEGAPMSPVQLQKAVFLFQQTMPGLINDEYDFIAYDYGPFCSDIYIDAQHLAHNGLATISQAWGQGYRTYAATPKGIIEGSLIKRDLPDAFQTHAKVVVDWVRAQSFAGLVTAIYEKYPQYRVNSVFKG